MIALSPAGRRLKAEQVQSLEQGKAWGHRAQSLEMGRVWTHRSQSLKPNGEKGQGPDAQVGKTRT